MSNRYALTEFGRHGERWVVQELRRRGYTVELISANSDYDLLVEGQARVEVKSATLTNGSRDRGQRWQFSLRRHNLSLDEELLFLLCYHDLDAPLATFIIPNHALDADLSKIDITNPDPTAYAGKWAQYLDDWDQVARVVSQLPARKPTLFRELKEEIIPF